MRLLARLALAVGVGAVVATTGYAVAAAGDEREALGPGVVTVEIGIERSAFDIGSLRVQEGTLVQFVVRNDDPIDHELVVGDGDVHRRHADGSERRHPPVPGEVSVAPGDTSMTFYEFTDVGSIVYACHLPGHVTYGMAGTIEVVPAS
ncbi:MAG: plastocyanin/azurin family copper-binding protein [Acidimicrobiales bacterium]